MIQEHFYGFQQKQAIILGIDDGETSRHYKISARSFKYVPLVKEQKNKVRTGRDKRKGRVNTSKMGIGRGQVGTLIRSLGMRRKVSSGD